MVFNQITDLDFSKAKQLKWINFEAFYGNQLMSVTIEGKSSSADFTNYPTFSPFGWASGYNDNNIIWNG